MRWMDRRARGLFLHAATHMTEGALELVCPDRTFALGFPNSDMAALMAIHDMRVFRRVLFDGELGLAEAYMDGQWSSPDLVALLRLTIRNLPAARKLDSPLSSLTRVAQRIARRATANTPSGSRRNIQAHYDLGNEFFSLFLDRDLAYSSGIYERPTDSLEDAQIQKYERICRKLELSREDRLLEIGTGWGGFAAYAASHYGCRVTTTTISREQHAYAAERFARLGEAGRRIELLAEDYRSLTGTFDKIVSIEMFEAVGLDHYDDFFGACEARLRPNGAMLLQTITMNEQDFPAYHRAADWMQAYIFPGSELACLSEILKSLGRVSTLRVWHLDELAADYALTLAAWRHRFTERVSDIRALGMDDRFIRMWDLYLAYCQAAFSEYRIGDVQLMLVRSPWLAKGHRMTNQNVQMLKFGQ